MINHVFSESEVLIQGFSKIEKDAKWHKFMSICRQMDFTVKVTGGNFLTHSIDCSIIDFLALLELTYDR